MWRKKALLFLEVVEENEVFRRPSVPKWEYTCNAGIPKQRRTT
jgi:hypothetical protein